MTSVRFSTPRPARRAITVAIVALLAVVALATASPATAQEAARIELGVKPIGVDGSYFEVMMSPAESRQLTVEFGNFGMRDAVAMIYAADVYSLVNGGMGVRLAGEPTSGATGWLGFEAETIPLAAGEAQLRTFAVSVPADAAPGEYLTSLVIEDATPAEAPAGDGVVANRVNRQAIAVAITVPGPIVPSLTLGSIQHVVSGGRSIVTVEVENSGNVRLQPSGEFFLTAASGGERVRIPVTMESIYAGTSTVAEIPFTTRLDAGDYTAALSLTDASHAVTAATPDLALTVPVSSAPVSSAPAALVAPAVSPSEPIVSGKQGLQVAAAALAVGVFTLALSGFVVAKRALSRPSTLPVTSSAMPKNPASAAVLARPVTIRQLDVPRRHHLPSTPEQRRPGVPQFRKLDVPDAGSPFAATAISGHSQGA